LSETELTFGQRVHLTQREIKAIFTITTVALIIGIALFAIVLAIGIPSVQFMESFGIYENRLNTMDGPFCEPLNYGDPTNNPAQIFVIEGQGADKAGLKDGDIIKRINDKEIANADSMRGWAERFPSVEAGDFVDVVVNRYGLELFFSVETSPRAEDLSQPLLGVIVPESPTCYSYFLLNEGVEFTEESMSLVIAGLWIVIVIAGILGIILVLVFVITRPSIRDLRDELADIENEYLDENYVLTFSTTPPQGKTDGEKIFNTSQRVFPELREDEDTLAKWEGKMKLEDGYEFDCYETTNDDVPMLFIAKHFGDETITLEKIQELCDKAEESNKDKNVKEKIDGVGDMEIYRVICVGRNYEPKLLGDEKDLEKTMDELDFDPFIDLVLEKDGNYSIIWIDYE